MKLKSKLFTSAVAFSMALSMIAVPAAAQTTAELTAQINSLLAMIAQLQAQIAGMGGSAQGPAIQYNTDLTLGSTGADVTALQQFLVLKGWLQMPAGVAYGYFGPLTQAALGKYQASVGITPPAGYFGPITRAHMNAMATTPGTTPGTTVPAGSITTPGVEGIMTVTNSSAGLVSTAYEGDSMASILGFKVKALYSDIAIQRVKLYLGTNTKVYNAFYSKLYITDESGNVLASTDLNSSTVVKEGSSYYVTITGFNYVVPKDATKQIYVKADVYSSVDSSDISSYSPQTIQLANNGVRGIDGAGIDQYSPTTGSTVTKSVTIAATLADSATLAVSLNGSSPKTIDLVATENADGDELDKVTGLVFDVKAEKDALVITDLVIGVSMSNTTAGANASTTVYLYDGSTELDSAAVTSGFATFVDLDYAVPKNSTKTLTAKTDIRDSSGTRSAMTMTASSTGMVAENSLGDTLASGSKSGTATGYAIGFIDVGPEITLVSKSVTTNGVPQVDASSGGTTASTTSTLSATFNVKIKAVGGDLRLGTVASSAPLFSSSTSSFKVYRNGAYIGTVSSAATSTSYTIPSTCVTGTLTNGCTLSEGAEVTVPVTFQITGRNAATAAVGSSGLYSVGLEGLAWYSTANSTTSFMAGLTDWRTADVSFP